MPKEGLRYEHESYVHSKISELGRGTALLRDTRLQQLCRLEQGGARAAKTQAVDDLDFPASAGDTS